MAEGLVMPPETSALKQVRDPRTCLVQDKFFSLRPKPLERWLWEQRVPHAAERVFWFHWAEGMRSGDWCSQIPVRRVAYECCVDLSTVTRAYQLLKSLGLIRRQDPGRDPGNPFQQATAVTEVRLPLALLVRLTSAPNRLKINKLTGIDATVAAPKAPSSNTRPESHPASVGAAPTRADIQATWARISSSERSRYFASSRAGVETMVFDADTRLTAEDQHQLLRQLEQMAHARNTPSETNKSVQGSAPEPQGRYYAPGRRLSLLTLARTRQRVLEVVGGAHSPELIRQVVWAIEEGALRRFEIPLAINIALKKVREGAWTRPNRMPPNWSRLDAAPEHCGAA